MLDLFECFHCRQACAFNRLLCRCCQSGLADALHPRSLSEDELEGIPLIAMGEYTGVWAALLKAAKSQPQGYLTPDLANLLSELVRHWVPELRELDCEGIVSVPSHPLRGFLQTDLSGRLALELSRQLKWPLVSGLLKFRTRAWLGGGALQKTLNRQERLDPHREARFFIPSRNIKTDTPRPLLLVDDICATGSTLRACKHLLDAADLPVRAAVVFARSYA